MSLSVLRLTIVFSLGAAFPLLDAAPPGPPATVEPALEHRTLPNGFRIAFLPTAAAPGRVSLRLIVHAGSLDERDDERGFAHFVEHMAFNGTRHYPPGKLVPFFQNLGLNWGADANADTSFTHTTYKLDLPAGHASSLGDALQVLADYAGGIVFAPAEVSRERGVILSELAARDTDEWQVRSKNISIYYAGSSLPDRLPIGDAALIRTAKAPALRRFYERCYRPERMTLVVTGDIASGPLHAFVEKYFAPLRAHGPAAAQVLPRPLAASSLEAEVVTSAFATAANVTLTAISPVGPDTPATLESALGAGAVMSILDRRLAARRAALPDRIGVADAFFTQGVDNRYIHYGVEASAAFADWPAALDLVETELRRAREQGFTDSEVRETVSAFLAALRAEQAGFGGSTPDRLANNIASILAAGREWRSPSSTLALAENYFAHFSPATAVDRLRAVLPDERLHVVLLSHAAPVVDRAAVLAAYRGDAVQPLAASTARPDAELHFPYENFGPPGAIVARRREPALGIELLRFANGARLNLRPSSVEPRHFQIWARLGRGTADIPRDQPGINLLAIALMSRCDLGKLPRADLTRLTGLHAVEGNWSFDGNDFVIQASGPTDALPFALQSITAFLADLKLEAAKLHQAVSLFASLSNSILNSTVADAKAEALFRATGADPRFLIPSQAEIERFSYDTVASWLRTHWLDGPLEVGLAGDFKTDDAVAAAAASIGTLSSRRELPSLEDERVAFRAKDYRNLTIVDAPDKTAAVRVFWPVRDSADLRKFYAVRLAAAALEDRLRLKLRQELGATYSPSGLVYRDPAQPDFGVSVVELTFAPANAQKLVERTIQLADEFARRGLSREEFARLREPLRATALADLQSNEWWLNHVLTRAQSQPAVLEAARTHGTAFDALTRDEVNRAAATHFRAADSNCVGFIPRGSPPAKQP